MTRRGGNWEWQLELRHEGPGGYRDLGLAWVTKTAAGTKTAGGKTLFASKGPPDFIGFFDRPRHQGVVFDAKSTELDAWPYDKLALHQAKDLQSAMGRGAIAFLAIQTATGEYLLPWEHFESRWWAWWQTYKKGDRKPIPHISGVDRSEGSMYPIEGGTDWLKTLIRWNIGEVG